MGFFSWKTSDTEESIANDHTGHCRPVYLLQPGGQEPICEPAYEGYGIFGGVDAYEWAARANVPAEVLAGMTDDQVRDLGLIMTDGTVLRDTHTGELWSIRRHVPAGIGVNVYNFPHDWRTVIPELGMSPSDLRSQGRFEQVRLRDLLEIKYPLKFSFDKDTVYEDVKPAKNCPHQGYFFPEPEEDDYVPEKSNPIKTMKL